MHFGCYNLEAVREDRGLLFELGGGVLIEIATEFGVELPRDEVSGKLLAPTSELLSELLTTVAPASNLQQNIEFAVHVLGHDVAYDICTSWLKRTHAMAAVSGSFSDPTVPIPEHGVDTLIIPGRVANWMLRMRNLAERIDPDTVGQVILPVSSTHFMDVAEHQLVASIGGCTQKQFAEEFIVPALKLAGFGIIHVVPTASEKGNEVMSHALREFPDILEGQNSVLALAATPNVIQTAGSFRRVAQLFDKGFDYRQHQLFMMGDTFRIAGKGEPTAHGQNPVSGLGQILRNFKFLLDNATAA